MKAQIANPVIADLHGIQDRVIATQLALKGAFDAEFKRLDEILAEANEKLGMIDTVEDAQKVRADADSYAAGVRGTVDDLVKRTRTAADAAASKLSGVESRESAVGTREASVQARADKLDSREKSIADAQNSKDAELTERETAATRRDRELAAAAKQLDADRSAFNKRLEALKA